MVDYKIYYMQFNCVKIKELLKKENPIIIEIGSHKGFETIKLLNEFKDLNIYCFEPDPRCIKAFKSTIKDKRCTLIEMAVSDRNGKTILNMSGGYHPGKLSRLYLLLKTLGLINLFTPINKKEEWDFSSSIKTSISNSKKYPWLNFDKITEVNTITLDTWIKQENIEIIDLAWVDAQGAEKDIINGSINALKIIRYFFTEYGETDTYPDSLTRNETIDLLKKYNFEIISKYSSKGKRGDLLFKNKFYS